MKTQTSTSATARRATAPDAIALLKEDHKKVSDLFAQYEKLGDKAKVAKLKLARKICAELKVHTQIEEEILYPAARAYLPKQDDLLDEAQVEHNGAKQLMAELDAMQPDDDLFDAKSVLEDYVSGSISARLRGGWNVSISPKFASYAFDPVRYAGLVVENPTLPNVPFVAGGRTPTFTSGLSLSTPQFQKFSGSVGATVGNDVDFNETSRVRRFDYNATLNFRPSTRLRITGTYAASSFTRRSDDVETAFTKIPRLKLEYQVSRPIFVRVVSQYTATLREGLRDPQTGYRLGTLGSNGAIVPSTRSASNFLRTDWLFSYRPNPGTVAFLGYGGTLSESDPLAFQSLRRTNDSFFIKLSYVFRTRL